ncbi:MAG: 4Fe-4S binding protein [Syntrophobacterales bacterium]|nr:4Fe-4S binding protein [Syntrophobacterales bacterium]
MRRLLINEKLCIGCYACYNACEHGVVRLNDEGYLRKISILEACREGCIYCKDICPTGAIAFVYEDFKVPQEILLAMASCVSCGLPMATEKMIEFLSKRVEHINLKVCPDCRRRSSQQA